MTTLQDIKTILKTHKENLSKKYGFDAIAVFGSYSREQQSEASDVDILVEFSQPIGIEFIDLAEELEKVLNKRVDLVSKRGIKPAYFKQIERELSYV